MTPSVASDLRLETPAMLEPLEVRIAPATLGFVDVDGDDVTVTTSKGTTADLTAAATITGGQLTLLDLTTNPIFAGTSLKIEVTTRSAMGDGQVNVGFIDATGIDLAAVTVKGDIGKIKAGDVTYKTPGVATLAAQSIGTFGLVTQGNTGDLEWQILGGTKSVNVAGDVDGALLYWFGDDVTVGSITIGGSLHGGGTTGSGQISLVPNTGTSVLKSLSIGGDLQGTAYDRAGFVTAGVIGKLSIGGDLIGAPNDYTGSVLATVSLGDVFVGGNLLGHTGLQSGSIVSLKTMGAVKVLGDLAGSMGTASGTLNATESIKSVTVDGNLYGGSGSLSGAVISSTGAIGAAKVGGMLYGYDGNYSGTIFGATGLGNVSVGAMEGGAGIHSGSIEAQFDAKIGNVTVGNSVLGGAGTYSGAIVGGTLGAVKIGGDLVGGTETDTGVVYAGNTLTSIAIGGNLIGGTDMDSGRIWVVGTGGAKVKFISVGGDIQGGGTMGSDAKSGSINVVGTIDKLTVGGSIIGGTGDYSGTIMGEIGNQQRTSINTVIIGGDVEGGAGEGSGYVALTANKTFTLGGGIIGGSGDLSGIVQMTSSSTLSVGVSLEGYSVEGGGGEFSGQILVNYLGKTTLAGSITGGTDDYAGYMYFLTAKDIFVGGGLYGFGGDYTGAIDGGSVSGTLKVTGGLLGGFNANNSGAIRLTSAKTIDIGGSIQGGNASMSNVFNTGAVLVSGHVGTLTLGGSLVAGVATDASDINLGAIRAGSFGNLTIKGDVLGNAGHSALITGQGNLTAVSGKNLAIGNLTINGKISYANILGGYDTVSSGINGSGGTDGGSAQIGTVTVKGSWSDTSIATGAEQTTGFWGTGNNVALSKPAGSSIVASIAKIVINGPVRSPGTTTGIVAESILSLVLSGFNASTVDGAQVGPANNMHIELV